jgi:hypothetical protein
MDAMNDHDTAHARRALGLALALALIAVFAMLGASVASAGSWMEVSCVNPSQSAAPSEGWSSFQGGAGYGSNNGTGCAPGSPMYAILSTAAAVGVGANETLQYTPPGGSTLIGGSIDVSLYADGFGFNASGTAVAYSPAFAYDGSDVFFQCAWGLTPCSPGSNDFSGVLGIPSGRGGNLYLSAGCGGAAGQACNEGGSEGAWSLVRLWWANLLLANSATPSASGFGGTLLGANASGTQDLTFTAADPGGPGVYLVTVQIDGKIAYSGTPNNNEGKCVPVGTSGGALMFDYGQPCRTSESVDLPIHTTTVPDGQHSLKVIVEDAAQNTGVVYDGTISTQNATSNGSLGAMPGPGTAAGSSPAGGPNGTTASRTAQLRLGVRSRITRPYARRALLVAGRLLDNQGQPIVGATLDVLQRVSGLQTWTAVGHAKTGPHGTFAAKVPGGPSRSIQIGYRAFSRDPGYSAQAKVEESVGAGVQLHVTPSSTTPTGVIVVSGRVMGRIPPQGALVHVVIKYRGLWVPLRNPRTDAAGYFYFLYQFQGAIGSFPVIARVPDGQANFPYGSGHSQTTYVIAR